MSNHYFDPRLKIFSLNSNRPLAEKIAAAVGVELGKCSRTNLAMAYPLTLKKVSVVHMSMLIQSTS